MWFKSLLWFHQGEKQLESILKRCRLDPEILKDPNKTVMDGPFFFLPVDSTFVVILYTDKKVPGFGFASIYQWNISIKHLLVLLFCSEYAEKIILAHLG